MLAVAVFGALAACSANPSATSREPNVNVTFPPASVFSDTLLHAAIKAKLAGGDIDSATRVSVIVRGSAVTLRGVVKDAGTRERDAQLVRGVRGVKSVQNDLVVGKVGRSAAQTVTDAALIAAVEGSLLAQTGVNVTNIKVNAMNGTITLEGHAASSALKSTMLDAAKKTPGVRNVVDRIAVK